MKRLCRSFLCFVAATAALGSAGCAIMTRWQVDQKLDAASAGRIEKGMSKEQVTEILGAPQHIIFSNKEHDPLREHAYKYEHSTEKGTWVSFGVLNFFNSDTKKDLLFVFFDERGRVAHVAASLDSDQSSYGFPFGK